VRGNDNLLNELFVPVASVFRMRPLRADIMRLLNPYRVVSTTMARERKSPPVA
jgi:hypothetical protein